MSSSPRLNKRVYRSRNFNKHLQHFHIVLGIQTARYVNIVDAIME